MSNNLIRNNGSKFGIGMTVITIIVIIILFAVFIDLGEVYQQLRMADWHYMLAGSIMLIAGLITFAVRWRLLLGNVPTVKETFNDSNMCHMFNLVLPLRAGEAVRIFILGKGTSISYAEATSSVVVEKLIEQIMRITAIGGAIVFGLGLDVSVYSIFGAVLFLALAFTFLLWMVNNQGAVLESWPSKLAKLPRLSEKRIHQILVDVLRGLSSISSTRQLSMVMGLSVLTWMFFWSFYYVVLLALDVDFTLQQRLAISLGALGLAPPSASTLPGFYHASIVAPLAAVGFAEVVLTAYTVLLYAIKLFWMTFFGVLGLIQERASTVDVLRRISGKKGQKATSMSSGKITG
jgi:uncharacterized protein (TIRG00374 family)